MKKIIISIALLGTLAIIGNHVANADPRWMGGYAENVTTETSRAAFEARQKFFTETLELRKEIAAKRIELNTLFYDENADQETVETLRNEIFTLQEELHRKGAEAGIGGGLGYGMMGYGCPGSCWR